MALPPSLHRYLYAFGNPTVYFDPSGRQSEKQKKDKSSKKSFGEALAEAAEAVEEFFSGLFPQSDILPDSGAPIGIPTLPDPRDLSGKSGIPASPGEAVQDLLEGAQRQNVLLIDKEEVTDVPSPAEVKEAVDKAQAVNDVLQAAQSSRGQDRPVIEDQSGPGTDVANDPIGNYDPEAETHSGVIVDAPSGFSAEEEERRRVAETMVQEGELTLRTHSGKGTQNPRTLEAMEFGLVVHKDQPGMLPEQLRERYPETEFRFTSQGGKGQDVEVVGGRHPSEYPGSSWPESVNHADFKPDSESGRDQFERDQKEKWKDKTHLLTYDNKTGDLRTNPGDE